ncbi:MAG TPA: virulence factor [Chloroflexota bacterium]|jgi:hypothetical protein
MAEYQVLYWRNIPSQVKAMQGGRQARELLPQPFQNAIDAAAMHLKLTDTDDYLAQWHWGPVQTREGEPEEVAKAVAAEIAAAYPRVDWRAFVKEGEEGTAEREEARG